MWFAMLVMFLFSVIYSIGHLKNESLKRDQLAQATAETGFFFAFLGLTTGMLWAQYTWGYFMPNDPKLQGVAISILVYSAYFILRGSFKNPDQKSRISAIYNIFAFVIMIVFIQVLPRLQDGLHPGSEDTNKFIDYDMDGRMRPVFYIANVGWILFAGWMAQLRFRILQWNSRNENIEDLSNEILD